VKLHAHRDLLGKSILSRTCWAGSHGNETRDRAGRFFDLDHQIAAALALPDLGAAVKRVVRLLLEHSGDGLTDDVLLVLGEPLARM